MSNELSYSEAFQELKQIVDDLESSDINVDQLDKQIKRAGELLKICNAKLHSTEQNVEKALKEIEDFSSGS